MINLHYNYVLKLLKAARADLDVLRHREALKRISTAFKHLDVMQKSEQIRGDVPLKLLEERRLELIELVNALPPTYHG